MITLRSGITEIIRAAIGNSLMDGAEELASKVSTASPRLTGNNADSVGVAYSPHGDATFSNVTTLGHGSVSSSGGIRPVVSDAKYTEVIVATTSEYGGVLDIRAKIGRDSRGKNTAKKNYMTKTWRANKQKVLEALRGAL